VKSDKGKRPALFFDACFIALETYVRKRGRFFIDSFIAF
jgi:hypothetical protein